MSEPLPLEQKEVKITEFRHIQIACQYIGANLVLEKLEKLSEQFPKVAGLGLAVEAAKAEVSDMRTRMLTSNIKLAMENGMDLNNGALAMKPKKDGIYLWAIPHTDEEPE